MAKGIHSVLKSPGQETFEHITARFANACFCAHGPAEAWADFTAEAQPDTSTSSKVACAPRGLNESEKSWDP